MSIGSCFMGLRGKQRMLSHFGRLLIDLIADRAATDLSLAIDSTGVVEHSGRTFSLCLQAVRIV